MEGYYFLEHMAFHHLSPRNSLRRHLHHHLMHYTDLRLHLHRHNLHFPRRHSIIKIIECMYIQIIAANIHFCSYRNCWFDIKEILTVGVSFQIHSFPFHSYSAFILLTRINSTPDTRQNKFVDDNFILKLLCDQFTKLIKLMI